MNAALRGIAEVERETGLGKDTLRVWERRYGFPTPSRDPQGERLYDEAQVLRLRLLRRLLDGGHRPGQVVPLPLEALQGLLTQAPAVAAARGAPAGLALPEGVAPVLNALRDGEPDAVRRWLADCLDREPLVLALEQGLSPLAAAVGAGWADGRLSVYQEHLFTELAEAALRARIARSRPAAGASPRVLLSSLPGEQHRLGLLMAEAALTDLGCTCLALGPNTPLAEIAEAAQRLRADVVAIGSSAHAPLRGLREDLARLRGLLPPARPLWLGGAGRAPRGRGQPEGVRWVARVGELAGLVEAWRTGAAAERLSG